MDTGTIIGIAGIVIGVGVSLLIYFLSRQRRELTWDVEHNLLIEGSKTELPIYLVINACYHDSSYTFKK